MNVVSGACYRVGGANGFDEPKNIPDRIYLSYHGGKDNTVYLCTMYLVKISVIG